MAIKRKTHLNLSGSHHTLDSDNAFVGGFAYITGSLTASQGISSSAVYADGIVSGSQGIFSQLTGSLSGTLTGAPFLVNGGNMAGVNYNSSTGQWEITGSAGGGTNFFTEIDSTNIFTTSSVELARLSASLGAIITGSVYATSSNFNINGFNIVPLWNHATTSFYVQNALLSGSLLIDNMPNKGVGLLDLNVIAVESGPAGANFGSWKMVVTMTSSGGINGIAGITEIDNVLVGTDAASWDVNLNNNQIEVTGSSTLLNSVYWMAKLTHKMILANDGTVIY
jgi:hypothetical protein